MISQALPHLWQVALLPFIPELIPAILPVLDGETEPVLRQADAAAPALAAAKRSPDTAVVAFLSGSLQHR
jgi:hypothetical protein